MIQETSIQAYDSIFLTLGERQMQVVRALYRLGQANNRMIAEYLKLLINSVTPRVKELRDKKIVGVWEIIKDSVTNRETIYWKLTKLSGGKHG